MVKRMMVVLAAVVSPVVTFAQPLADKVPADTMLYIGWAGAESLGEGYQGSHLEAILQSSNLPKVFEQYIPDLVEKLGEEEPDAGEAIGLFSAIAGPMWTYPSAYYFAGMDLSNPNRPMPKMGYLIRAGDQARTLAQTIQKIVDQGEIPVPFSVSTYGDLLAVTSGREAAVDALLGGPAGVAPAPSLADGQTFSGALKQVHSDPVTVIYADVEGLLKLVDQGIEEADNPQAAEMWPKIRDAIGLNGLQRFIYTGAFQGQGWSSRAFLAAPAPRTGLVAALLDPTPVSDEMLRRVPKSAAMVGAATGDLSGLLNATREAIEKVDPDAANQFDQALMMGGGVVGMDLETQLLDPLGKQWIYYLDPQLGGFYGLVMINQLDDADAAAKALTQLGEFGGQMVRHQSEGQITIGMRKLESEGQTIHYLSAPLFAPSWAVKDGVLYVALYPQIISSALARPEGSILDNPEFMALRKSLGGENAAALSFMDVPQMLPRMYEIWLPLTQYLGLSELIGVEAPAMVLPPMHKLAPHVTPAASVTRVDDAGLHFYSQSAFPGSRLVGGDPSMVGVGGTALGVSILLPSLNRAREQASRVGCASNLRQIGLAALMHASENDGQLPQDLGSMLKTGLSLEVFICPSTGSSVPALVRNAPMEEQARWVNENSDYTYLGADLEAAELDDETVLAFEEAGNHGGDGGNVLYGDGHVQFHLAHSLADELEGLIPPEEELDDEGGL